MKRTVSLLALFLLAITPAAAWANVGSPVMIAGMLHLMFGNLLIGLGEGLLLGFGFRLSGAGKVAAVFVMIAANYVSMWVGMEFLTDTTFEQWPHHDIYNVWSHFWLLVLAAYGLTLVVEFPFVAALVFKTAHPFRNAVLGTLMTQTASYLLLLGWYGSLDDTSLYSENNVVPLASMRLPKDVTLYYISAEDGDVYRRKLDEAEASSAFDLNSKNREQRVFVGPSAEAEGQWDLLAHAGAGAGYFDYQRTIPIILQINAIVAPERAVTRSDTPVYQPTGGNYGPVPRLGAAQSSPWKFTTESWGFRGLTGNRTDSDAQVQLGFDTPFGSWLIRNAVHLPGDIVLFQLGTDQICVYDPESREVALVTRGRGPAAVIEKGTVKEEQTAPDPEEEKVTAR